ncbi:Phosphoserine aminotransferase [Methyloligella halotolerans]|uniref:phosphoserine transaminase n=1 Tax=Methyloligella halotolerans TaxID=1177755 RepID=A0A1E2RZK2_9HYPH|nr:phosphoserine transaminase [Methyloligella halotolerans]ODA67580.1 Phosphoserine aminotransferase [Methyloligella halotolerans]
MSPKPSKRPENPRFSCGPCSKHPGWSVEYLQGAALGRNHRSQVAHAKFQLALEKSREILRLPDDYLIGLVPASDTGAMEMAMWTMLGARGVDVLAWEAFSADWVTDIVEQLKLTDVRAMVAPYGELPDLNQVDFKRDVVFAWNGTTSGVRVPNADWIAADRAGLTICDATSAIFAQELDWSKLDVITYSWQKVLGGEAAHGMLILSPRAVQRLKSYTPPWPVPKIFRLTHDGVFLKEIFEGSPINTPSMLCLEDYLDALSWVESIGGLDAMMARANANAAVVDAWVERTDWVEHLAVDPATRSNTSVCLKAVDPDVLSLPAEARAAFPRAIASLLDAEDVAKDIASYRTAPPGLRLWAGGTVESSDLELLMPWLDWGFAQAKQAIARAA